MSKAFTRESDDVPERPTLPRLPSSLPPGAINYMTVEGERRLREELTQMVEVERPRLAAAATDPESKMQLQILDQQIRYRQQSLHSAVVVPPPTGPEDRIRFGATVTVRDRDGESRYRIVGVDEVDASLDYISYLSPIARALLNRKVGDKVPLKGPSSGNDLEIIQITYE